MDIKEDEVKEINKLGNLNGDEVKIITLKGGLHIGIGKKSENSLKNSILAVASHPALVSHQIAKKFEKKFEQTLNKNENKNGINSEIIDYSNNLNSTEKNVLSLNIYAIKDNDTVDFKITKHNFEVFSVEATKEEDTLFLNKITKNEQGLSKVNKTELSKNLEKAIKEYAESKKLKIKKNF